MGGCLWPSPALLNTLLAQGGDHGAEGWRQQGSSLGWGWRTVGWLPGEKHCDVTLKAMATQRSCAFRVCKGEESCADRARKGAAWQQGKRRVHVDAGKGERPHWASVALTATTRSSSWLLTRPGPRLATPYIFQDGFNFCVNFGLTEKLKNDNFSLYPASPDGNIFHNQSSRVKTGNEPRDSAVH